MENEHDKCEPSPFLSEMFGPQTVPEQTISKPKKQTEKHQKYVAKTSLSDDEQEKFARDKWKSYQERLIEKSIAERKQASTNVADGEGDALTSWDTNSAGPGFLQDAGYTTRKDGPDASVRQRILKEVFLGAQQMPGWLSDSVTLQWGAPQSVERFNKIRSTINVGLGTQKGRPNPSIQAIQKWEDDLLYMDSELREMIA
jgi:hypothetical protein